MTIHDVTSQRLFLDHDLAAGNTVDCTPAQANYLANVLRLSTGAMVLVFNGRDGEWQARVERAGKRDVVLQLGKQTRSQTGGPDISLVFAPLKRARLDYLVQKATELGAARLVPVLTQHTVAERVNGDRMRANAIEAAEQCGILRVPEISEPQKFDRWLAACDGSRRLIFCDEAAAVANPIAALTALARGPMAILIGPEGGFAPREREQLLSKSFVTALSLGPRIMRADTAAVAALALANATLGDWAAATEA